MAANVSQYTFHCKSLAHSTIALQNFVSRLNLLPRQAHSCTSLPLLKESPCSWRRCLITQQYALFYSTSWLLLTTLQARFNVPICILTHRDQFLRPLTRVYHSYLSISLQRKALEALRYSPGCKQDSGYLEEVSDNANHYLVPYGGRR